MAEKPTLVLIHGLGAPWGRNEPSLPILAQDFDLILFDLPGYAGTSAIYFAKPTTAKRKRRRTPLRQDLLSYVWALEHYCQEHNLGQVFVLGHSFGSYVATAFALRHPERCAKLVLVGAPIYWPFWLRKFFQLIDFLSPVLIRLRSLQVLAIDFLKCLVWFERYSPKFHIFRIDITEVLDASKVAIQTLRDNVRIVAWERLEKLVPRVTVPYLLLYGENDLFYVPELHRKFSSVLVLEKSGHGPMEDSPEAYAEALKNFFLG